MSWFSRRPVYHVVTYRSKNGLWRWQIRDDQDKILTLMSGRGHDTYEDCLTQAAKLTSVRFKIERRPVDKLRPNGNSD